MQQRLAPIAAALALVLSIAACDTTETGEGGTQYQKTDVVSETRSGVDLVIQYDAGNERFTGTMTNTTNAPASGARVEIHLSNGVELGPTPKVDLSPGQEVPVTLDARGQSFTTWAVHIELGSGSG